jgi:hypothetical protein
LLGNPARAATKVRLKGDGNATWRVDGSAAPQLAGCLGVDLEASACTNAAVNQLCLGMR